MTIRQICWPVGCVGVVVVLAIMIYLPIHRSLEAEVAYQRCCVVLEIIHAYLEQNPGKWPRSWDELAKTEINAEEQSHSFGRPADIDRIRARVHIDFDLTLADVAKMDVDHFTAVVPIGPNYGLNEGQGAAIVRLAVRNIDRK